MGQFPVVYFTFNGLDGTDFDSAIANLADKIYRLAAEFEWLLDSDKLNSRQKKELSKLLDQDLYSGNKAKGLIASSLITLCSLLLTHFNRHPVVLIDEYGNTPAAQSDSERQFRSMQSNNDRLSPGQQGKHIHRDEQHRG